jgi:hypothetical protein
MTPEQKTETYRIAGIVFGIWAALVFIRYGVM